MYLRRMFLVLSILFTPKLLPAQGSISLGVPLKELIQRATVDSNDPAAHYNLALSYWSAKRWSDVDHELKLAIMLDPRFAEAHLALGFLQIAANQNIWGSTDQSKKDTLAALTTIFNREYRHAFLINPKVDFRIMASVSRNSDEVMLRAVYGPLFADYIGGISDCREGKYADCENRLTNVIQALVGRDAPDDAHWYRGLAAAHVSHYDVAEKDFKLLLDRNLERVKKAEEKGLIRTPIQSNEYRYFRAVFLHMQGDTVQAFNLYHEVLENDLGMYIAHVRLAEIFEARRDYSQAVEERQRAIDASPDDRSLLLDLGITLGKAGRVNDAEAALKTATEAMPRNIETWFWLGLACEQTGDKAEAKAAYEKVIALAPSRFKARADQAKARIAALKNE